SGSYWIGGQLFVVVATRRRFLYQSKSTGPTKARDRSSQDGGDHSRFSRLAVHSHLFKIRLRLLLPGHHKKEGWFKRGFLQSRLPLSFRNSKNHSSTRRGSFFSHLITRSRCQIKNILQSRKGWN